MQYRYIVAFRDPVDVCASFYPFLAGWFYTKEEVELLLHGDTRPRTFIVVHRFGYVTLWRYFSIDEVQRTGIMYVAGGKLLAKIGTEFS